MLSSVSTYLAMVLSGEASSMLPPSAKAHMRDFVSTYRSVISSPPGDVIMLQRLVVMSYMAIPDDVAAIMRLSSSRRPALTDGRPGTAEIAVSFPELYTYARPSVVRK